MNTQWMVKTYGDPLSAIRRFVGAVWLHSNLDGMLVPLHGTETIDSKARILNDPGQLTRVNPFKPLMICNAAKFVAELAQERPDGRFGAILRPCEMRTLIEMVNHHAFQIDNLLTICLDCLGTLPADEHQWRAERKGSIARLTLEALQFVRQGGIVPFCYRSACQMCLSSEASKADLNIGVLGLPVRQYILVTARNEVVAKRFQLDTIADSEADPALVAQRERLLIKLAAQHNRIRERITRSLVSSLPTDVDQVVNMLEICGKCQACLEVCPICYVDFPRRGGDGRYLPDDVARWLISCAGCGMCEQVCPHHLPLNAIFGHIREQLIESEGGTLCHSLK